MDRKKGFTLIELLVVIAIIALLLSILIPSLLRVKEAARCLVCQTNMKGLVTSWYLYLNENRQLIPSSYTYSTNIVESDERDWAWAPWDTAAGCSTVDYKNAPLKDHLEGIRRGSLYPYVESMKPYHCPSDKKNYRTYSMPDSLNGQWGYGTDHRWPILLKKNELNAPAQRYIFLEEQDPRGYNINSWALDRRGIESDRWMDPFVTWHAGKSCLAFGDGHTEAHKWSDETTDLFGRYYSDAAGIFDFKPTTTEGIADLKYVHRGWPR